MIKNYNLKNRYNKNMLIEELVVPLIYKKL